MQDKDKDGSPEMKKRHAASAKTTDIKLLTAMGMALIMAAFDRSAAVLFDDMVTASTMALEMVTVSVALSDQWTASVD